MGACWGWMRASLNCLKVWGLMQGLVGALLGLHEDHCGLLEVK